MRKVGSKSQICVVLQLDYLCSPKSLVVYNSAGPPYFERRGKNLSLSSQLTRDAFLMSFWLWPRKHHALFCVKMRLADSVRASW